MPERKRQRSWNSVCADCKHLIDGKCAVTQTQRSPDDGFAAICRTYKGRDTDEKQNYKPDAVE